MRFRGGKIVALAALCAAIACSSSAEPEVAQGAVARFELAASGSLRWGAVPFPSDLYLAADGTVDLASPPTLVQDEPVWQKVVEQLRRRRGFCTTCNVYFGIEGTLDRAKLPKSAAPGDAATASDAVVMIDADPASPERGKAIPLQLEWNGDDRVLAARPVPWIVLRKNRKYAVAITSKLRDVEGRPLRATATFAAARDGGGDAAAERARKVVGPALDELVKAGVSRAEIVSVAAFTTGDPTVDAMAARKLARGGAAPTVVVTKTWSEAAALDELLGVQAVAAPGLDAAGVDPARGPRAVAHDEIAQMIYGSFESPHVRKGPSTEGGVPMRGADGAFAAEGTEKVPFLLSIPKAADLGKLPVVIVMAGLGSSAATALGVANTFARAGVAVLAIDPPCQGGRSKDAIDKVSELRSDKTVPDGIVEGDNTTGAVRGLGLIGPAAGEKGNPEYLLGFSLQTVTDLSMAVRLAKEGDLTALRTGALATLSFDPSNIFMLGNHFSTVHVPIVAAVETDLAGIMLNAFIPAASDILFEAPGNRVLAVNFSVALAVPVDLDETVRRYAFHPSLDLMRWVLEPGEGRAFYPYLYADPLLAGPRPDLLVQNGKLDEYVTEEQAASAVVALGIPSNAPMQFAPVTTKPAPLEANLTTKQGTVTAGSSVFTDGMARMMWFADETSNFEPPFMPPAKVRATPLMAKNPIVRVHAQLEAFVRARVARGHAEILAP